MKLLIGLSRGSGSPKYENYRRWLATAEGYEVDTVDLYVEDLTAWLPKIDGLILTGGGDIDPALYDREDARDLCTGIDRERDRREKEMLTYCIDNRIPVLGICRGLQWVVVHLGGTLIPHIPEDPEARDWHTGVDGEDNSHEVTVEIGSLLHRTVGELDGEVNSSHHQGVREVPAELAVTARSRDGLVEAVEWKEPEQKNYLVAVQWHPERMDVDSPFSGRLLEAFLLESASSGILKRTTPPAPKEEPETGEERSDSGDDEAGKGGFSLPIINN